MTLDINDSRKPSAKQFAVSVSIKGLAPSSTRAACVSRRHLLYFASFGARIFRLDHCFSSNLKHRQTVAGGELESIARLARLRAATLVRSLSVGGLRAVSASYFLRL